MAAPTKLISTSQGFQDAKGNVVANGVLTLQLSQSAEITATNGLVTTQPVVLALDANGKITSTAIWFNDELTPSGTTYHAVLYGSNGASMLADFGQWSIVGASSDLSTMVPTTTGASYPGAVLLLPSGNQVITQTSGTNLSVNRFEQIRFADQFSGADMGAKIAAAISDLPSTGGIVDATAFQGAQAAAATINVNKPVSLRLGGVTLSLSGSPGINLSNIGANIVGLGPEATFLQTTSGTADIIQTNAGYCGAWGLSLSSTVARTNGAGIRCKGGNGNFENITIDKTFNGIQITDSLSGASGSNCFYHITMGSLVVSAGSWNAGIILGVVASGTVTGEFFSDVVIQGSANYADAMLVLDSGCDTIHFDNCQFVQTGTDSFNVSIRNTSTSNDPQWCKFTHCVFEAGNTKTAITTTAGKLINFENCSMSTCQIGLQINGGKSIHFTEGKMVGFQQQAINITVGTDIRICGNRISDASIQTNGGYNSIQVSANINDFSVTDNDFTTILSSANQPFNNVNVASGTSTRYKISGNTFANNTSAGLSDNGTGSDKFVAFNSPTSSTITTPLTVATIKGTDLTQASLGNTATLLNLQDAAGAITGDSTDKTFYTYTLPASTMAAGKGVRVTAAWIHGTGTASITYKLFFGATAVVNSASAVTGNGMFEAIIMNQPASTTAQRASSKFTPTGTASVIQSGLAPSENTGSNVVIKGTFNVANTDQITPAEWVVELIQ